MMGTLEMIGLIKDMELSASRGGATVSPAVWDSTLKMLREGCPMEPVRIQHRFTLFGINVYEMKHQESDLAIFINPEPLERYLRREITERELVRYGVQCFGGRHDHHLQDVPKGV